MSSVLFESNLHSLSLLGRGKVRDIYAIDAEHLLIVTTDRLSAFDVVLPDPIPEKGRVLTTLANFWFHYTESLIPNHLTSRRLQDLLSGEELRQVQGRAVIVQRLRPLPLEAVVRGFLIGSGWKDYQASGKVCGIGLPAGLQQAERLPEPIFTPATKAESGAHDENIDFEQVVQLVGRSRAEEVRSAALEVYCKAAEYAERRGIIIADTKFEFGLDHQERLVLMDEALTPDSSRFWPKSSYVLGSSPPSYDKQYVRDYLETLTWDKKAPGPRLPAEVIAKTAAKYSEALRVLVPDSQRYSAN